MSLSNETTISFSLLEAKVYLLLVNEAILTVGSVFQSGAMTDLCNHHKPVFQLSTILQATAFIHTETKLFIPIQRIQNQHKSAQNKIIPS